MTKIEVEHIRLEAGEILILDGVNYLITSVERLYYMEVFTMTASRVGQPNVVNNLRPEDDEVYHVEHIGIAHEFLLNNVKFVFPEGTSFKVDYPRGDPRFTPHGLDIRLDEDLAPKFAPFRVDLWVKPATEPALISDNMLAMPIQFASWWFGWKYRTKVITSADVDAARSQGVRILEIERYVSK